MAETIPGGKYINDAGFWVNANGEYIDEHGKVVDEPVDANPKPARKAAPEPEKK